MSGKLCLTPTPISSDIPNKVRADRRWQRRSQKTVQSSQRLQPRRKKSLCDWWGGAIGDHGAKNCVTSKNVSLLWHFPEGQKKPSHDAHIQHVRCQLDTKVHEKQNHSAHCKTFFSYFFGSLWPQKQLFSHCCDCWKCLWVKVECHKKKGIHGSHGNHGGAVN